MIVVAAEWARNMIHLYLKQRGKPIHESVGPEMMRRPTLFLTVGLPCTGKTTAARRIEIEQRALRLTKDEWVKALYGHENPPSAQDVIEGRLIQIGLRAREARRSQLAKMMEPRPW